MRRRQRRRTACTGKNVLKIQESKDNEMIYEKRHFNHFDEAKSYSIEWAKEGEAIGIIHSRDGYNVEPIASRKIDEFQVIFLPQ